MLVSHSNKFIYVKTFKTAGSSVELLFQEFCLPPEKKRGAYRKHPGLVSDFGIVGSAARATDGGAIAAHTPPSEIIELVGRPMWDEYLTFACVRNPWDKVVSNFFWERRKDEVVDPEAFERYTLELRRRPADDEIVARATAVDAVIRFENLAADTAMIAERCGVVLPKRKIPTRKSGLRPDKYRDYRSLYTRTARAHVKSFYANWIDAFGYRF